MYKDYTKARDKAWTVLLEANISTLPLSLSKIAKHYGIQLLSYSDASLQNNLSDGYSLNHNGRYIIYYNDKMPKTRSRFTVAHELGHCLLGHLANGEKSNAENFKTSENYKLLETQANIFARDILMPAIVLHSLGVASAAEISKICNVSITAAEIRWQRLQILDKRNRYKTSPLEKKIDVQFKDYIFGQKNERRC
jgi:Zn-dependent peptidase ImmA (M78 family)